MSVSKVIPIVPAVALGIARGRAKNDFQLAVRLQQRAVEADDVLRDRIHQLAGGEVDVRYVGRVVKQQGGWRTGRHRPLLIGSSVGQVSVTAGPIGLFPKLRKTGLRVLLSNNHVLANENRARLGDPILQPGPMDGGADAADIVGFLADFVPLKTSGANLMDAAIASLIDADIPDPSTLTGAPTAVLKGVRDAPLDVGDQVFKIGRTTGLTEGRVSAIEVDDAVVDYEIGSLRFDRQFEIEGAENTAFSDGGDSGSLVFDAEGLGAALLFAGSDQGGTNGRGLTYATELTLVLGAMDIELEI